MNNISIKDHEGKNKTHTIIDEQTIGDGWIVWLSFESTTM